MGGFAMTLQIVISFAIILLMIVGFVSEIFPLSVTAMLGCLAFFVTGIIDSSTVFSGFSNDIVFMIAGTMIVGEAMFQTGAAQFIGKKIIKAVGYDERRMIFVLILAGGLLSAFTSNSSVMAMFLPLIRSVAASSNGKIRASHIVMPVGISTMVGGACTLVGSTPQLVAQGLLAESGVRSFSFFELGYAGFPLLILLALWFSVIAYKPLCKATAYMPAVPDYMADMKQEEETETKANPKMYVCFVILIAMVVAFLSGIWTVGVVASLAGLLCIVTGCISAKTAYSKMGWNALIIVGATLGVASGLNASGAAEYIANVLVKAMGQDANIVLVIAVVGLMCVIMSNLLSHTATISLLVPIFIPLAHQMGIDPTLLIYTITCCVMCGYATPLGVASYAMTLAEGYSFRDYQKIGGPFNIVAYVVIVAICSARFIFGF
jgi:cation transporter